MESLNECRVCGGEDKFIDLFNEINNELLNNLKLLVQSEIEQNDGFSKFICLDCAGEVEKFIKFKKTYEETSNKIISQTTELCEIEALNETFDNSSDNEGNDCTIEVETKDIERKEFCCEICNKSYRYLNSLSRHKRCCHENFRYKCELCSLEFTQKSSLVEHTRNLHKANEEVLTIFHIRNDSTFDCELCQKSFNTAKMFQQHKKLNCLLKTQTRLKSKSSKPKTKYRKQCSTCGLFFKHIDEHKLSHQSENTFRCEYDQCAKTFKFKNSLDVHIRIHKNERRFECPTCKKKFRLSHHLKEHLSTHSTEKKYICDVEACGKKFSSKLNLYKHSKLHFNKSKK